MNTLLLRKCKTVADILALVEREGPARLNTFNQVTALHRLSKAGLRLGRGGGEPLVEALVASVAGKIDARPAVFTTRHLVNTAYSLGKMKVTDARAYAAIATACGPRLGEFNAQDVANLSWAYATAEVSDDADCLATLRRLPGAAQRELGSFTSQGLSNTVWAFATMGLRAPELMAHVAAEGERRLGEYNAQELANTVWAYAKCGAESQEPFLRAIARAALAKLGDFNPQNLTNTAWAFATAGVVVPELFDGVAAASVRQLDVFNPQNLSNTGWAFAKVGYYDARLFRAIAARVARDDVIGVFNPQNLSNVAWSLAKRLTEGPEVHDGDEKVAYFDCLRKICDVASGDGPCSLDGFSPQNLASLLHALTVSGFDAPDVFSRAPPRVAALLPACNAQDISNTVWSFASNDIRDARLFDAVDAFLVAEGVPDTFGAQNVSNVAWSFAKVAMGSDALFGVLGDFAASIIDQFSNQNCSNTLYAFALANRRHDAFFRSMCGEIVRQEAAWSPSGQDIANSAWALATIGLTVAPAGDDKSQVKRRLEDGPDADYFATPAFAALSRAAVRVCGRGFNSQNIANCAWAYARAGSRDTALFDALARVAEPLLDGFKSQELANLAWAYAKLNLVERAQVLFLQLARVAQAKLGRYNAQDVTNTLWAFASNDLEHVALFEAAARHAAPRLRALDRGFANPQKVATLAWSYAKAAVYAPALMDALAAACGAIVDELLPVDVANVAWAFAAVGETDRGGLFEALKDRALAVLDDLSSQELANLVWSFSNLDDAAPCRELWLVLLDRGWTPAIFDDVAKSQLQQAYLRLTLDGAVAAVPPLDGEWARALQAALTTSDCALGSRTQLEVSAALDHLGWAHSYEYFEARSGAGRARELQRLRSRPRSARFG